MGKTFPQRELERSPADRKSVYSLNARKYHVHEVEVSGRAGALHARAAVVYICLFKGSLGLPSLVNAACLNIAPATAVERQS